MAKIAIIEDDMAISQMYRIKFEMENYQVETAENGKVGLTLVEKMKPDIILLDLMMPEMTGDQMLAELRKKDWGKSMKVIILTNVSRQEAPESLIELEISRYVVKAEMTGGQVAEIIKEVIGS